MLAYQKLYDIVVSKDHFLRKIEYNINFELVNKLFPDKLSDEDNLEY